MSLLGLFFRRKKAPAKFDPNPGEITMMPSRPYRILHAGLPFYADARCEKVVDGARLLVLECQDPNQKQKVVECMPAQKDYERGQLVSWELNNKMQWDTAWYKNPESGKIQKAWSQSVEFAGRVVKVKEQAKPQEAGRSASAAGAG